MPEVTGRPEDAGQEFVEYDRKSTESRFLEELNQIIRDEAVSVKDCFTRFSFQTVGFTAVALGAIARLQSQTPLLALAVVPVILMLGAVSRIGTVKYNTANRNVGYSLHLDRSRRQEEKEGGRNVSTTLRQFALAFSEEPRSRRERRDRLKARNC